jgi:ABC-2 type transport system ATP-binding protein
LLKAKKISHSYRNHVALDGITVDWPAGVRGLLGPNGAGKTTLLRILATVVRPTSGSVQLMDCPVWTADRRLPPRCARGLVGFLPQDMGTPRGLTARELVEYAGRLRGIRTDIASQVDWALGAVGAREFAGRRVQHLSGGQRQRVGIAAAIVGRPPIVLLDEPTSGLDPNQRIEFRALLRELGETSTVILSTHLIEDVALGCDTVSVLHEGHLIYHGDVSRLEQMGHDEPDRPGVSPLERAYLSILKERHGDRS